MSKSIGVPTVDCPVNTPTLLITGATSGLGLALARLYTSKARPILVGRKPLSDLDDPLFNSETYCQCDLSKPDCAEVVEAFLDARGVTSLDSLIHNAGLGYYGEPAQQSAASIDELLQVNLYAPISLTHKLFPQLKKVRGKVVFISSISADLPAADYAVYSATKAALGGFARNLRLELGGSVRVQTLYPGAIRTDMHAKSGVPEGKFKLEGFPSVEKVAQQAVQAIEKDAPDVTLGFGNKFLRAAGHYFSTPLDTVLRLARR